MSPIQKESWGMVVGFICGLVACVILIPLLGIGAAILISVFWGIGGLVASLIFRKRRNADLVAKDERTEMIIAKADKAAGMAAFQVTIFACLIPWGIYQYQGKETISIVILPFVLFMAMTALWVGRAIAILVLFGREPKDS